MIDVHSVGPFYYGWEHPIEVASSDVLSVIRDSYELADQRRVTYSWFVEDEKPYRRSIWGFRIKLRRDLGLHMGLCKKGEAPHRHLAFDPSQIRQWGGGEEDVRTEERSA